MNRHKLLIITIFVELILIAGTIAIFNPFLKIELKGEKIIEIPYGAKYADSGVKATFFGKDLTNNIFINSNFDISKIGEYRIEYIIDEWIYSKKIERTIKVIDVNPPEITLLGEESVNLCGKDYEENGYEAKDDVDGDLTDEVVVKKETDRIIYTVSDKSGNKTEVVRTLIAKDDVNPVIKLNNSEILTFKQGSKYVELGATAHDNCDGDITSKIEITSNVDTSKHEIFTVTYTVKDIAGNEATATRKIKIYTEEDMNKGYSEVVNGPTYINGILIVNKKYSIPASFDGNNDEAKNALSELQKAAKTDGYNLALTSGFRSYENQKKLIDNYASSHSQDWIDRRAAREGHSEHETGLAFDLATNGNRNVENWLKENCAKYGFIIRYPQYKQAITGYDYEPWHIRYVGVEVATEIMEREITLEEYLGIYELN